VQGAPSGENRKNLRADFNKFKRVNAKFFSSVFQKTAAKNFQKSKTKGIKNMKKNFAESIDKKIGINSEIAKYVAALEPRSRQNNYDMGR